MSKHAGKLIQTILSAAGIKNIWGITGDSANFITSAISESDIKFMHVRHEVSGAFAAGAESLITGKLTACIGSCGPGSLHFLSGLYDANKNGASVLCIATQVPAFEIGTKYVQETNPKELFRDCSVFCEYITQTDQIPRITGLAMQAAVAKKGVAVIIVPSNVSSDVVSSGFDLKYMPHYANPVMSPSENDINTISAVINSSAKVGILYGGDCRMTINEIKRLSNKIKAPVAWNLLSRSISNNNIYNAGCADNFCDIYNEDFIKDAEVLIMAGVKDMPDSIADTKAVIINIGNDVIDYVHKVHSDYMILSNVYETFVALNSSLNEKTDTRFADDIETKYKSQKNNFDTETIEKCDNKGVLRPEYLFSVLNKIIPEEAVITSDIGTSAMLTGVYIEPKPGRQFYQSSVYGTIGSSLPMSLGAAASNPGKKVVAICGDGGISMLLGEMITINQMNLDIKVIILNNSGYEFTGYINKDNPIGDEVPALTDFSKVAASFGLEAKQISGADDIEQELNLWLNSDKAMILEVKTAHIGKPDLFFKTI